MQRIILAGIKHSGKSTIGWDLSSKLGLYFADLDDLILRDSNKEPRSELRGICVRRGCGKAAKNTKPSSPKQASEYSGSPNKYKTVRELYKDLGADGFKKQEMESLKHFLLVNKNKSFVLSLGGGTIENPGALELLKTGNVNSFFLDADSEALYERIIRGGLPPFLEGDDPQKNFDDMYTKRSNMYQIWAEHLIDTRGLKPPEIADIIADMVQT